MITVMFIWLNDAEKVICFNKFSALKIVRSD